MSSSASGRGQLFVGRVSKDAHPEDLEKVFSRHGNLLRCDIKSGAIMNYAFIDFEDPRDAKDAMRAEHGRDVRGSEIVVEYNLGPNVRGNRDDGGGFRGGGGGFRGGGGGRRSNGYYDDYDSNNYQNNRGIGYDSRSHHDHDTYDRGSRPNRYRDRSRSPRTRRSPSPRRRRDRS